MERLDRFGQKLECVLRCHYYEGWNWMGYECGGFSSCGHERSSMDSSKFYVCLSQRCTCETTLSIPPGIIRSNSQIAMRRLVGRDTRQMDTLAEHCARSHISCMVLPTRCHPE